MIKCVTQKKINHTQELAEEALIGARTRFDYADGHGPVAVYHCDDCGYFHLTPRGPVNAKLKASLGEIDRQKRADQWTARLKRKGGR